MRKSYIAKGAEALNLHNGKQTAIVVKMKLQPTPNKFNPKNVDFEMSKGDRRHKGTNVKPENLNCPLLGILDMSPYQIGQEVYVRETIVCNALAGAIYKAGGKVYAGMELSEDEYIGIDYLDKSYRGFIPLCKEKHARTRFKIVGCEVVRVKDLDGEHGYLLGFNKDYFFRNNISLNGLNTPSEDDIRPELRKSIILKLGQSAWDNNDYIWYYKIEKI